MQRNALKCQILLINKTESDDNGCWLWQGGKNDRGYGQTRIDGQTVYTHRLSYEAFRGDTGDRFVCHRCDCPACCNPAHLFLGSHLDNMQDAARKHRNRALSESTVARVKELLAQGMLYNDVRLATGVSDPSISSIARGNSFDWVRSDLNSVIEDIVTQRRTAHDTKSSKYRGVTIHGQSGRWRAVLSVAKQRIDLGCFDDEIDAARAYDAEALKRLGDKARLNFPDEVMNDSRAS